MDVRAKMAIGIADSVVAYLVDAGRIKGCDEEKRQAAYLVAVDTAYESLEAGEEKTDAAIDTYERTADYLIECCPA